MITDAKPWELAKDENQKQTLNAVLYRAAETLRWLCVLLYPVMPRGNSSRFGRNSAWQIQPIRQRRRESIRRNLKWGELAEGTAIGEVKPLFPRIDKVKTMKEINDGIEVQSPTSKVQRPRSKVATSDIQQSR